MALNLLDGTKRIEVKDSDLPDVEGGDPETVYIVRQIPPDVNRQLSQKHTTRPINRRTGQRENVVDNLALVDEMVDWALVDWRGILLNSTPVPCTSEYKQLLDYNRKVGLLSIAGLNQVAQEGSREASFRSAP